MRTGLYNAVSVLFFILTLGVITAVIALLAAPAAVDPAVVQLPTFAPALPTAEPTETPTATATGTATLPATFTAVPATATHTPSATLTTTPRPSETAAPTVTPSETATPTETAIPYPFVVRDEPVLQANTANTLGCDWQGVGGRVFDSAGAELSVEQIADLRVHVYSNSIDRTVRLGTNSLYGERTGWEVATGTGIAAELVYVRLETTDGRLMSNEAQIEFPADCDGNAAVVEFVENPRRGQ